MNIIFNDQLQVVTDDTPLQLVLDLLIGEKQKGIAVAINDQVVPKAQWPGHIVKPNDNILVIKATQGG